jgi:TonB family protein
MCCSARRHARNNQISRYTGARVLSVIAMFRQQPTTECLSLMNGNCFTLTRIGVGRTMTAIMNRQFRFLVPLILAASTMAVGQDSNNGDVPKPAPAIPQYVWISQGVSQGLLIKRVQPDYPNKAIQNGVQGQVVMTALISKTGNVEDLTLVSGHPLLVPAASKAVKKWKYKPYQVQGNPVEVKTTILVNFQLRP